MSQKEELIRRSIYIVSEYYKGNLRPFLDNVAANILWIGPRGGQILQGKQALKEAWANDVPTVRFSMGNILADSISTGSSNLEVLLQYYVYTYFPTGEVDRHHQRLHYSWGIHHSMKEGKQMSNAEIYMIHLSNITAEQPAEGRIYAKTLSESRPDALPVVLGRVSDSTVPVRGKEGITYYLHPETILWAESTDNATHSILHALDGDFLSIDRLRHFAETFGDVLLRCHGSFLVNPRYVRSIGRFNLTLTDGTVLPIPEKKYTAFRKELEARIVCE